ERQWKSWLPRLKSLPVFANIPPNEDVWAGRFDIRDDGQLILYLEYLDASDLSQLKDLPVADLYLHGCKNVTDVRALEDMQRLENITVPALARNIEALHKLPKLKRLSFSATQGALSADRQNAVLFNERLYSSVLSAQQHDPSLDQNAFMRRMQLF